MANLIKKILLNFVILIICSFGALVATGFTNIIIAKMNNCVFGPYLPYSRGYYNCPLIRSYNIFILMVVYFVVLLLIIEGLRIMVRRLKHGKR